MKTWPANSMYIYNLFNHNYLSLKLLLLGVGRNNYSKRPFWRDSNEITVSEDAGQDTRVMARTVSSVPTWTSVARPAEEAVTSSASTRREVTSAPVWAGSSWPRTITLAETSTSAPGTTEAAVTSVRTRVREEWRDDNNNKQQTLQEEVTTVSVPPAGPSDRTESRWAP